MIYFVLQQCCIAVLLSKYLGILSPALTIPAKSCQMAVLNLLQVRWFRYFTDDYDTYVGSTQGRNSACVINEFDVDTFGARR